jgi:hypothetical protein
LLERAIAADPQSVAAQRAAQALEQMIRASSVAPANMAVQQPDPKTNVPTTPVRQSSTSSVAPANMAVQQPDSKTDVPTAPVRQLSSSSTQLVQRLSTTQPPVQPPNPLPAVRINWGMLALVLVGVFLTIFVIGSVAGAGGVTALVISTSIWVFFDARSLQIGRVAKMEKLGAFGWMVCCLMLWILFFPVYLAERGGFKRIYHGNVAHRVQPQPATGTLLKRVRLVLNLGIGAFLLVILLGVLVALGSQHDNPAPEHTAQAVTGSNSNSEPEQPAAHSETSDNLYEIVKMDAQWRLHSNEDLWVPELRMQIKNMTDHDLQFQLEARFLDGENVLTADDSTVVKIPAGYTVDTWLQSYRGYTSDWPFLTMADDESQNWHYELFGRQRSNQDWQKITSGVVALPPGYSDIFSDDDNL